MNLELCKKCVQSHDYIKHTNSVCEICYQIETSGNGENAYYIERIEVPICCGKCKYCKKDTLNLNDKKYCKASKTFDKDERDICMQFIRKNYLTKGTPKWCPMKNN